MCLPALAATVLSPSEIQAQFGNGTPFHGVTVPGGRRYSLTLNTDGTAQMTLLNDKSSQTGTWRASKSGYCSKWGAKPEHCYTVEQVMRSAAGHKGDIPLSPPAADATCP